MCVVPSYSAVDLLVADVLLDRIVRQVARAAEALQRHRQKLVDLLGTVALDERQQQVVATLEQLRGLVIGDVHDPRADLAATRRKSISARMPSA
jgi:hypothetical protein